MMSGMYISLHISCHISYCEILFEILLILGAYLVLCKGHGGIRTRRLGGQNQVLALGGQFLGFQQLFDEIDVQIFPMTILFKT